MLVDITDWNLIGISIIQQLNVRQITNLRPKFGLTV